MAIIGRVRRAAPPHTRGWTRLRRAVPYQSTGSPAHAGMDPTRTLYVDGLTVAPPHTRGWTRPFNAR